MAFYDLSKEERARLSLKIRDQIEKELRAASLMKIKQHFEDEDTYIRKAAYIALGRIYFASPELRVKIIKSLQQLFSETDFRIRQSVINSAGEIGKTEFEKVSTFFDEGLFDEHHSPRNAVIGSIKKMGEVNPVPVLAWAKLYLHHENKEIRREICHGIELRGRKHPQEILPLLKELQHDKTARVRNTLVHVIGQIAYKKGCLAIVIEGLKTWGNQELVAAALEEIIDVHHRYRSFAVLSQKEAREYIREHF